MGPWQLILSPSPPPGPTHSSRKLPIFVAPLGQPSRALYPNPHRLQRFLKTQECKYVPMNHSSGLLHEFKFVSCPKSHRNQWRNSWMAFTCIRYPFLLDSQLITLTDKRWVALLGLRGARTLSYVSLFLHLLRSLQPCLSSSRRTLTTT